MTLNFELVKKNKNLNFISKARTFLRQPVPKPYPTLFPVAAALSQEASKVAELG